MNPTFLRSASPRTVTAPGAIIRTDNLRLTVLWWCQTLPTRIVRVERAHHLFTVHLGPSRRQPSLLTIVSGPGAFEAWQPEHPSDEDRPVVTDPWGNRVVLTAVRTRRTFRSGRVS